MCWVKDRTCRSWKRCVRVSDVELCIWILQHIVACYEVVSERNVRHSYEQGNKWDKMKSSHNAVWMLIHRSLRFKPCAWQAIIRALLAVTWIRIDAWEVSPFSKIVLCCRILRIIDQSLSSHSISMQTHMPEPELALCSRLRCHTAHHIDARRVPRHIRICQGCPG